MSGTHKHADRTSHEAGAAGLSTLVEWMARNHVAANILMLTLLFGGLAATLTIKQEVFPRFQLDIVDISISYPGATPQEVEDGIVLPIEEQLLSLDVVDRVVTSADEGGADMEVELLESADPNRALQDITNTIDSISFFPEDAERPTFGLRQEQTDVMWMVVYGPLTERQIFELADRIRRDLLALPAVKHVELRTGRGPEIQIEIPQATLRSLGMSLGEAAQRIRESARDVPAGGVRTDAGEVLLSTRERRDYASEYGDIVLMTNESGTDVRVADVAAIRDGFQDRPLQNLFNGGHGMFVSIYETGDQKPLEIADAVNAYLEELRKELPEGVDVRIMRDRAEQYQERLNLLMRNGLMGLTLVLVVLGLFLEPRLAFWVALGIPTTIAGSLLLLPFLGASINMVSLFAFIITLGIIVDDAIIVGENVFHRAQQGESRMRAAIIGSREMTVPVMFAVLTNIVAFVPLLFVPGENGRFFAPLPAVVIAVFLVSLMEALFVLPAHLGHGKELGSGRGLLAAMSRGQRWVSNGFDRFTDAVIVPLIRTCVHWRFLTLSILFAGLAVMLAWYYTGRMHYTFSPVITGLRVDAEVQTPVGSAFADTVRIANHVEEAGLRVADRLGGRDKVLNGRMNVVGRRGENFADVNFYLVEADLRTFSEGEFAKAWREEIGDVPGMKSLYFEWEEGPGSGAGLTVELSHPNRAVLEAAATRLSQELATFTGVSDIKDGFSEGKMEIEVDLTKEGLSMGLTPEYVGRQVRHAFYGAEAMRFQRGRHEVKVMVRLPEHERRSLANVEDLVIQTPSGGEAALSQVARLHYGVSTTEITRVDGQRVVNVTCNTVPELANVNDIRRSLNEEVLPSLAADFRGLTYEFGGRQREEDRAMDELRLGLIISLLVIFAMLAALFRSYVEGFIISLIIPFGAGSALFGHVLLGYDLSIVSLFGIMALSGMVVNSGLVLNEEINRLLHEERMSLEDAVVGAGRRRFRPIVLTSLTTFAGLAPMIFETSSQARFLVPMAIALGFGTILSTPVSIILPACLRTILTPDPNAESSPEPVAGQAASEQA
ncbi:MAG: efflux RND transporter permease subunit [Candidatus Hydrogenedentes bacterium]|nr:efflux RND transporter permease subunit [Candidatus Hydrogenedentota bacterium]